MYALRLATALAIGTLAAPAGALAHQGGCHPDPSHGKAHHAGPKHGHPRGRGAMVEGAVTAVDPAANTVTVSVSHASRVARSEVGQAVTFDVSRARIRAGDTNGSGKPNELADVRVGDRVTVHVHLKKGATTTRPIPARQLIDLTSLH